MTCWGLKVMEPKMGVRSISSEARLPAFKSQPYLTSLSLSFLICKVGVIVIIPVNVSEPLLCARYRGTKHRYRY